MPSATQSVTLQRRPGMPIAGQLPIFSWRAVAVLLAFILARANAAGSKTKTLPPRLQNCLNFQGQSCIFRGKKSYTFRYPLGPLPAWHAAILTERQRETFVAAPWQPLKRCAAR